MSTSRREFIKLSSIFAGGTLMANSLPSSIHKALMIEAEPNTTFLDAEHIVFLMQENRSFDHCFGTLQGVRGFNDPRAMTLGSGLPVWFQEDFKKDIYGPFRLDIENTKITWMGGLPHSWRDMVDARNDGKMDNWLIAKRPGNKMYEDMPLTMGYYTRKDIPFYYAFADAFTVCDQHFCSSLTGTSANRSYFWAGAIRENPRDPYSVAHVDNSQINYKNVGWKTYPERLEEAGVSWKVYQNELSLPVGLGDGTNWLANFTDNNLEFYKQYNVGFHEAYVNHMKFEIDKLERLQKEQKLSDKEHTMLEQFRKRVIQFSKEEYSKLSSFEKAIHERAFVTNTIDPDYHSLEEIEYVDNGEKKKVKVPKGDIFAKFRDDVESDTLPMVSWLVAPCNFSDHPSAPWYGAWYVSEVLNILTKNPEIWKKTIFILTYDENDGYFDHIAPFVPPLTTKPEQGKVPKGMDTQDEWVTKEQERLRVKREDSQLESPIGLGYRVPMVIASVWTKGGWVNSEVCDLTSTLQFLEYFIEKKTGKQVKETNISAWRRAACGNLTSVFHTASEIEKVDMKYVDRNQYIERILKAKSKGVPGDFNQYTLSQIKAEKLWNNLPGFPKQERGIKKACALPYNIDANLSSVNSDNEFNVIFTVASNQLKTKDISVPFQVYAQKDYKNKPAVNWSFLVSDLEEMRYQWKVTDFVNNEYHLHLHGPNGFFRSFQGNLTSRDIEVKVTCLPMLKLGVNITNRSNKSIEVKLEDKIYNKKVQNINCGAQRDTLVELDYSGFKGWYDFTITLQGDEVFKQQFAGHIENGESSITDPYMGSIN